MPDLFVPLSHGAAKVNGAGFMPLNSKTLPMAGKTATPTLGGIPEVTAADCAKPTITLQRQGEIVTGIKIRCGCGEVVELTCVY